MSRPAQNFSARRSLALAKQIAEARRAAVRAALDGDQAGAAAWRRQAEHDEAACRPEGCQGADA